MHIAVIGAGFTGLAVTWNLLHAFPASKIQLIDYKSIGQGTSGIAAGLLHPFAGAHAKLNARGYEGMAATQELLKIAAEAIEQPVIASQIGLPRLALSLEQQESFKKNVQKYFPENRWLTAQECVSLVPGCPEVPGLWISSALTIYSQNYLKGLWQACENLGAQFEQRKIQNLKELEDFDLVILATGAETSHLNELSYLPISIVKGQILELSAPQPLLNYALNSQAYLLMTEKRQTCLAGASYERENKTFNCNIESAKREILPKAFDLYPPLKNSSILNCFAGLRASTPTHLPFIKQISPRIWVLTGMGSKGLLYHALYAKELVQHLKLTVI